MKKELTIFIIMTLLVIIMGISYQTYTSEKRVLDDMVFEVIDGDVSNYPNDKNTFYLLFEDFKLDSKNFIQVLSYFDNFDHTIISVYPYVNPLYKMMLKDIVEINYNYVSLRDGIAIIYKKYINELAKYRLIDEEDKVMVNGFKIRMIKIEVNNEVLINFIKRYNGVKYSLTPYGLFRDM